MRSSGNKFETSAKTWAQSDRSDWKQVGDQGRGKQEDKKWETSGTTSKRQVEEVQIMQAEVLSEYGKQKYTQERKPGDASKIMGPGMRPFKGCKNLISLQVTKEPRDSYRYR